MIIEAISVVLILGATYGLIYCVCDALYMIRREYKGWFIVGYVARHNQREVTRARLRRKDPAKRLP